MRVMIISCFVLIPLLPFAQYTIISGKVVDGETKTELMSCQVLLADSTWSTTTDHMGYFSLWVPSDKAQDILISFLGYNPIRLPWDVMVSKEQYIALQPRSIGLLEVQVSDRLLAFKSNPTFHWRRQN